MDVVSIRSIRAAAELLVPFRRLQLISRQNMMALLTLLTLITDIVIRGHDSLHRGLHDLVSGLDKPSILTDHTSLDTEDRNKSESPLQSPFTKSLLEIVKKTTFRFFERTRRFSTGLLDQITDSSQKEWTFLIRRMKVNFETVCEDFVASFMSGDDREHTHIERFESLLLSFIAVRIKCQQGLKSQRNRIRLIDPHHVELKGHLSLSIEYLLSTIRRNFGFFPFSVLDTQDIVQLQLNIEEYVHVAKSVLLQRRQEWGVSSKVQDIVQSENDLVFEARQRVVEDYIAELSQSIGKIKNALETLVDVWNMLLGYDSLSASTIYSQQKQQVEPVIINVRTVFKEIRVESTAKYRVESLTYSYINGGLDDPSGRLDGYFRKISDLENILEQGMNDADVLIQSILQKIR